MVVNSGINKKIIMIFLYVSLLNFSFEQQCVQGVNCPFNQGECVGTACNCLAGFYSLLDPQKPVEQQTYCNYEQINVYAPIILEFFLPSIGHFYVGNYLLGLIKISILLVYIFTSYYLYNKFKIPKYIEFAINKFGPLILSFIGMNIDQEKEQEGGEGNKKLRAGKSNANRSLSGENEENVNRGDTSQIKQAHSRRGSDFIKPIENIGNYKKAEQYYDDGERPDNQQRLIDNEDNNDNENQKNNDKENDNVNDNDTEDSQKEKDKDKDEDNLILDLSSIIFSIFYFADLFLYKLKIYTDGNGVPFVE
jgi:hypothetical protein